MPRVLRIINRLNLGGPTYNAAYLTKYLEGEFETLLVAGMKDDTEESSSYILDNYNIKPVFIPEMKRAIDFKNDILAYKKIKKIIKDFKPDIVHTHAAKAGTIGRLAAYNCGVKVVVHTFHGHVFHSYFSPLKTRFYLAIEKFLAKKTSAIIAISKGQKNELTEIYKIAESSKFHTIPLGFDLNRFYENKEKKRAIFRKKYGIDENEIVITIIGRLVPIKNHRMFVASIACLIKETNLPVRGFIVGDGESRTEIESYCDELGINYSDATKENKKTSITFTSWIKEIDVVCDGSDIIALTSKNEGTPVSLIEAQASGKPIVTTNVGGIKDILAESAGFLCEVDDVNQFTAYLNLLCKNENLRKSMSEKGPDFAQNNFSHKRLCNETKSLYYKLLNEKNKYF